MVVTWRRSERWGFVARTPFGFVLLVDPPFLPERQIFAPELLVEGLQFSTLGPEAKAQPAAGISGGTLKVVYIDEQQHLDEIIRQRTMFGTLLLACLAPRLRFRCFIDKSPFRRQEREHVIRIDGQQDIRVRSFPVVGPILLQDTAQKRQDSAFLMLAGLDRPDPPLCPMLIDPLQDGVIEDGLSPPAQSDVIIDPAVLEFTVTDFQRQIAVMQNGHLSSAPGMRPSHPICDDTALRKAVWASNRKRGACAIRWART